MWDLDDATLYTKVLSFSLSEAFTYADTREGHTDRDKRERIRLKALENFPVPVPAFKLWAFRIFVKKSGNRPFDVENVPKLIVDAFSIRQIERDESQYTKLGLYKDDTIDFVKMVEIGGIRSEDEEVTEVEIFGINP